ncbi:hypothetical protein BDN72DRAFT_891340 [Pluteus cervinus]|uniref:Uncharacterized protein n=1 Tax=Pluteus cervinus TaxID=181527 RepID=A0ACD3BE03_9AGAR|nr:hypothetical protein BDN72DRAFT_891340 [Pluteus cervinus]
MLDIDQLVRPTLELKLFISQLWRDSQVSAVPDLWPAYLVLFGILFVGVFLLSLRAIFRGNSRPKAQKTLVSDAIRAILTLVTPTNAVWPMDYATLLQPCIKVSSSTVQIQFSALFELLRSGSVEIRNTGDIQDLLLGRYHAYGHKIRITYDTRYWLRIIRWIALSHFFGKQSISKDQVAFGSFIFDLTGFLPLNWF